MENSGQKILVVDDAPRLRDLLRRYLGEQGFTVLVAENATAMNKLWLRERGYPMLKEVADFWTSRVEWMEEVTHRCPGSSDS